MHRTSARLVFDPVLSEQIFEEIQYIMDKLYDLAKEAAVFPSAEPAAVGRARIRAAGIAVTVAITVIMGCLIDILRSRFTANEAGKGHLALSGAGRGLRYSAVVPNMVIVLRDRGAVVFGGMTLTAFLMLNALIFAGGGTS